MQACCHYTPITLEVWVVMRTELVGINGESVNFGTDKIINLKG